MKKKSIFSLILSIVLIMLLTITLCACTPGDGGDDTNNDDSNVTDDGTNNGTNNGGNTNQDDGKETYTFTLKDEDLNPVEGASVRVNVNGANGEVKVTDANGKVEFKVIKNAVVVYVEVIELPELYDMETTTFAFIDGKTLITNSAVKKDVYTIKVIDNEGNAVEGVEVQLCFGTVCLEAATTKANGIITWAVAGYDVANAYASLKKIPAGYELKTGEILNETGVTNYTHYDDFNADNELVIEIVKQNIVTVSAGDFLTNAPIKDIKVEIYSQATETLVGFAITGENGKAEFIIPKGEYYYVAFHKDLDPRYTWLYRESGRCNISSNNVSAEFVVLDEVKYTINVTRTNTEASLKDIAVVMYNRLFEEVTRATTTKKGVASIDYIPYDVYYVGLENFGEGVFNYYKIEKNGVVTHNVTIDDSAVLGTQTNPVDVRYGYNTLPELAINSSIYCKVLNPQGATLKIEADVIVTDAEGNQYTPNAQGIVELTMGNVDEIIKIEARDTLNYWGAELNKLGTNGNSELIRENETDGTESVNLINGKHYFEYEATNTAATLILSSNDEVKFEVDGVATNKAVLGVGDKVIFAVIGDGEVTFNISYAPAYYDYIVNVSKEIVGLGNSPADGIVINLIYEDEVIATAESVNGEVRFENIQEYSLSKVKADVASLPAGYKRFYENENGYYFVAENILEEVGGVEVDVLYYTAACSLSLVRDGSQETPYVWASEGRLPASAYTISIPESGFAYVESAWINDDPQAPEYYYVFLAGEHLISYYLFDETTDSYDFTNPMGLNEAYDAVNNVTAIKVPLNANVVLKITAPAGDVKVRWGTQVMDLSAGDPVATGTKDNPFALVFAQTIVTPDFVQGSFIDDPAEISAYYYTYTVSATIETMTIQVINNNADVQVYVNGNFTDISSGTFEVVANDVIEMVVSSAKEWDDPNILDGVSFAVKGA